MNTKRISIVLSMSVSAMLLSGCVSGWIDYEKKGTGEAGGKYTIDIQGCGSELTDIDGRVLKSGVDTLPVEIRMQVGGESNAIGCLGYMNNVLSFCTLGFWPYIRAKENPYTITFKTPNSEITRKGSMGERTWNSYILSNQNTPRPGGDVRRGQAILAASADVLTKDFYKNEIVLWQNAKSKAVKRLGERCIEKADAMADVSTPVLLIDEKDIVNKTGKEIHISDIVERIENRLNGLKMFRIMTKRSLERGVEESQFYKTLAGEDPKLDGIKVPAYRIEIVVHQYDFKQETKEFVEQNDVLKTFKRGTRTTQKANVELTVKMTDMKTGMTMFSGNCSNEYSDGSENSTMMAKEHGIFGGTNKALHGENYCLDVATNRALNDFYNALCDKQYFTIVDCSEDGALSIDAPEGLVNVGDKLTVYKLGRRVSSGRTGKVSRSETAVAVVKITSKHGANCTAEFVEIMNPDCDWDVIVRKEKTK